VKRIYKTLPKNAFFYSLTVEMSEFMHQLKKLTRGQIFIITTVKLTYMNSARHTITTLLRTADIQVNGTRPWDLKVHNTDFYSRVLAEGSLGFGESYIDGWWSSDRPDELITRILQTDIGKEVGKLTLAKHILKAKILNQQTKKRSKAVAIQHYDLDNELYQLMLDKNMQYTCGYYQHAKTLHKAQKNKLDLVCKKLGLKKGMTVLELGSGFGGLAHWMAKKYGCKVTAYNISKEQVAYGTKWCKGLDVTFKLEDYRNATGQFDRVVSIGMLEHVGVKNYEEFMHVANRCLAEDGLALFHTIGSNLSVSTIDPWIEKYIFPNAMLPSIKQLAEAMEDTFVVEDWHNFGPDYDRTLMAWHKNFVKSWPKLSHKYDEQFYRMWEFYLLSCAAVFRARKSQLWQIVVSKKRMQRYNRVS